MAYDLLCYVVRWLSVDDEHRETGAGRMSDPAAGRDAGLRLH
jgi:hypothetical protein